ncbi:unnamed protein product [Discosporangium mesarthrocarpum]
MVGGGQTLGNCCEHPLARRPFKSLFLTHTHTHLLDVSTPTQIPSFTPVPIIHPQSSMLLTLYWRLQYTISSQNTKKGMNNQIHSCAILPPLRIMKTVIRRPFPLDKDAAKVLYWLDLLAPL